MVYNKEDKRQIYFVGIIFILFSIVMMSSSFAFLPDLGLYEDLDNNWNDIQDWEFLVCSRSAGPETLGDSDSPAFGGALFLKHLTIAMQADMQRFLLEDSTVLSNQTLYRVSWYVEPTQGNVLTYELYLISNVTAPLKILNETNATDAGSSGYKAFMINQSEIYNNLTIHYGETGIATVPIVEYEEE